MAVVISMLRGINVGGHHQIKMDALRALYESLKLRDVTTYVQSGNVVFRTGAQNLVVLSRKIEDAIERSVGFRPDVILRTPTELRNAIQKCPFAKRSGIEPSRLAVIFLAGEPSREAQQKLLAIKAEPEELRIEGRELYIYYADGMARPKLSFSVLEKTLQVRGTTRNWNTVMKLLEIAEKLEGAASKTADVRGLRVPTS